MMEIPSPPPIPTRARRPRRHPCRTSRRVSIAMRPPGGAGRNRRTWLHAGMQAPQFSEPAELGRGRDMSRPRACDAIRCGLVDAPTQFRLVAHPSTRERGVINRSRRKEATIPRPSAPRKSSANPPDAPDPHERETHPHENSSQELPVNLRSVNSPPLIGPCRLSCPITTTTRPCLRAGRGQDGGGISTPAAPVLKAQSSGSSLEPGYRRRNR